ncbi:hypothetical protein B0T18DRAFT_415227 [Schizothecium vesticola]|uniref:Uncharacterized protein n=1 Tax=Schizothecium vesticola TaxID=314040 RepID=A0AA40EQ45_9PEZI|nr:hypothetical protein B0T18DRAFT_415227 [Schizothecium vesticola]
MTRSRHWAAAAWGSRGQPITSRRTAGSKTTNQGGPEGNRSRGRDQFRPGPDTLLPQHLDRSTI